MHTGVFVGLFVGHLPTGDSAERAARIIEEGSDPF
jgi:hypothetical protein